VPQDQSKADAIVAIAKRATDEIKLTGTPTFVIAGKVYGGELSMDHAEGDPRPVGQKVAPVRLTRRETAGRPTRPRRRR
jgi:hypothetical protein